MYISSKEEPFYLFLVVFHAGVINNYTYHVSNRGNVMT